MMIVKRKVFIIICSIIILIVGSASADSEIMFQNIPWKSSEEYVVGFLKEAGFINESQQKTTRNDNGAYLRYNEVINYRPEINRVFEKVCYSLTIEKPFSLRIAGCLIDRIVLSFAYENTPHLIAVSVNLIDDDYEQMHNKIEKVYGEGKRIDTEDGFSTSLWEGANNSAVLLYSELSGDNYSIIYGRLDAEEILESCLAPADPDDVSGL